jgi:hypothetical protein
MRKRPAKRNMENEIEKIFFDFMIENIAIFFRTIFFKSIDGEFHPTESGFSTRSARWYGK